MYQKLISVLVLVRLTPFDVQTEQGRSNERYRKATLSILANVLSRAFGVMLTLLSVSLTLPYLGVERFGIWMTVASFAGLLTFLDLGVGNALTNHVANRAAKDDPALMLQTISGGLGFLAIIGACIGLALWLTAAYLPWGSILQVERADLLVEARLTAMYFAVMFGISIFTSGVQNVFAGLQKAYIGHMVSGGCSLLACLVIWLATSAQQGITVLLTIMMGAPIISGFILIVMLKVQGQFTLRGIAVRVGLESKSLYGAGGLFFILQIGTMVGWGMDSLLISNTLGVAQVAVFSIVQRLFQFASQPISIINAPLWSAYADAVNRNDKAFIGKTLKRSLLLTFVTTSLAASLIFMLHPWMIDKWSGSKIVAPVAFVAAYSVWMVIQSTANAFSMYLNGASILMPQVITTIFFIIIVLPVKIIMVQHLELFGIVLAAIISYCVSTLLPYIFIYREIIVKSIK